MLPPLPDFRQCQHRKMPFTTAFFVRLTYRLNIIRKMPVNTNYVSRHYGIPEPPSGGLAPAPPLPAGAGTQTTAANINGLSTYAQTSLRVSQTYPAVKCDKGHILNNGRIAVIFLVSLAGNGDQFR